MVDWVLMVIHGVFKNLRLCTTTGYYQKNVDNPTNTQIYGKKKTLPHDYEFFLITGQHWFEPEEAAADMQPTINANCKVGVLSS
jgi:hypothetical protein